jgi:hypothetical protein
MNLPQVICKLRELRAPGKPPCYVMLFQVEGTDHTHTFATGETPIAAVEAAQDRAADFIRGLQTMHDHFTKGPTATTKP